MSPQFDKGEVVKEPFRRLIVHETLRSMSENDGRRYTDQITNALFGWHGAEDAEVSTKDSLGELADEWKPEGTFLFTWQRQGEMNLLAAQTIQEASDFVRDLVDFGNSDGLLTGQEPRIPLRPIGWVNTDLDPAILNPEDCFKFGIGEVIETDKGWTLELDGDRFRFGTDLWGV